MWVNCASLNGFEMAEELNKLLTELMTPSQIEEAQRLSRKCVRKNYKGVLNIIPILKIDP
ncbi:MAG: hypothetical protein ACJ0DD_00310 [Paracoccaceae bacterium]